MGFGHADRQFILVYVFNFDDLPFGQGAVIYFAGAVNFFGNYLYLNVAQGMEHIKTIHDALYKHELKQFDLGYEYIPHMTVGKLSTIQALEQAFNDVRVNKEVFRAKIDKISVEMIGDNEESIVIIEKDLR